MSKYFPDQKHHDGQESYYTNPESDFLAWEFFLEEAVNKGPGIQKQNENDGTENAHLQIGYVLYEFV